MAQQGVHAGANAPAYVFGKKNLDYVEKRTESGQSLDSRPESARKDFFSERASLSREDIEADVIEQLDKFDEIENIIYYYNADEATYMTKEEFASHYADNASHDENDTSDYYVEVNVNHAADHVTNAVNREAMGMNDASNFPESWQVSSKDGDDEGYVLVPADYLMEHGDDDEVFTKIIENGRIISEGEAIDAELYRERDREVMNNTDFGSHISSFIKETVNDDLLDHGESYNDFDDDMGDEFLEDDMSDVYRDMLSKESVYEGMKSLRDSGAIEVEYDSKAQAYVCDRQAVYDVCESIVNGELA